MRIISNFHDYYDGVQRTIFDGTVVYTRKSISSGTPRNWSKYWKDDNLSSVGIRFCGKYYLGYALFSCEKEQLTKYMYSSERLESYIKSERPDLIKMFSGYHNAIDYMKKQEQKENKEDFTVWEKYKSPIIVWRDNTTTVDSRLDIYNFQVVKDPFTTFQDIYTYLASKASPEKEIPKLDDITMRDIKGFDKYSFRKDKRKK